ncbi:MAG: hypothetical protein LC664_12885 [Flavobacteriales bacterium]|nr:hypothetical protein [Flavobacteriales bacterium]
MSIQEPIDFMIARLEAMPYFSTIYGLTEQLDNGQGRIVPVYYPDNSVQPTEISIAKAGATYFRKRGNVTIAENTDQNYEACDTLYTITVPLRLIAITKRKYFPSNNAYSADRLASEIIKAVTVQNSDLKNTMNVKRAHIRARTYSTSNRTILNDEFQGIENAQFNMEDIAIGLDVDVIIDAYTDCIETACDYVPKFYLLLEKYVALP